MRTRAVARVAAAGVLAELVSGPPLTIRRVQHADPSVCALCVVGSAAGPLAGDDIRFELELQAHARAELTAAGAGIAQGDGHGEPARQQTVVSVGPDAVLTAAPPPLIVAAGASVTVDLHLELAESATVRWDELLVLGRFGEPAGRAELRWSVQRDGRPLLRQDIRLGPDALGPDALAVAGLGPDGPWPGVLDGCRVLASTLLTGPGVSARTVVHGPHAVAQAIDERTVLLTVLDSDAALAGRALARLLAELVPEQRPVGGTASQPPLIRMPHTVG